MQSNEYETNDSFRSSYTPLDQTWCGQTIPKNKFTTFNPPMSYQNQCPADWTPRQINQVPNQNTQIVYETSNFGYNALTHNTPSSSSGYFSYDPAYNNGQNGYDPVFRRCDGTFAKLPKAPVSTLTRKS